LTAALGRGDRHLALADGSDARHSARSTTPQLLITELSMPPSLITAQPVVSSSSTGVWSVVVSGTSLANMASNGTLVSSWKKRKYDIKVSAIPQPGHPHERLLITFTLSKVTKPIRKQLSSWGDTDEVTYTITNNQDPPVQSTVELDS
jgi:hypothetical protein